MKQKVNTILSNLKPFGVYFLTVLIGYGLTFFGHEVQIIGFYGVYVVYSLLGILIGVFTDIKKDKYGLIAFVVMIIAAPLLRLVMQGFTTPSFGIDNIIYAFGSFGNMFSLLWNPFINSESFILQYAFSILFAFVPIAIGFGLKKVLNSRKAM